MKEKIKKIFKNEKFWASVLETLCGVLLLFIGYGVGFAQGVLLDNEIRNNIIYDINSDINENNKKLNDNISIKKANNEERYSPYSTIGEEVKVYFDINENFVDDIVNNTDYLELGEQYYLFYGENDNGNLLLEFVITFIDEQDPNQFFEIYFNYNNINDDILLQFHGRFERNSLLNFDGSDAFLGANNYTQGMSKQSFLQMFGSQLQSISNTYLQDIYFLNDSGGDFVVDSETLTNYVYTYDILQPSNFLTEFLNSVANITIGVGGVLTQAVAGVGSILFFNDELTIVGVGLAMALGVGAVYLIFRMVRGLIKQNNRG